MGAKTLGERIGEYELHPFVYTYPTPRMYKPLENLSVRAADFTDDVNVYIHIPFCKQMCSFCGYLKTLDAQDLRQRYVDAASSEISLYKDVLRDKRIRTIYFGGGTPSLLLPSELGKITAALLDANPDALKTAEEVSIEATPESVTAEKFRGYRNLGINRVSIGVESFNGGEIALSGRHNAPAASAAAVKALRDAGISNIIMDLMIGIDGQTPRSFEDSVLAALSLRPASVELFALALVPNTRWGRSAPKALMPGEQVYRCYEAAQRLFQGSGYRQDFHNRYTTMEGGSFLQQDYMFRGLSLIGFGAGARSHAKDMHYRNIYDPVNSRRAVLDYIAKVSGGGNPIQSGIRLGRDEKIRRYAIGNIEALDKRGFYAQFGVRFEDQFPEMHKELLALGLAVEAGGILKLTPRGLIFRDIIAKQFFSPGAEALEEQYRQSGPVRA